LFDNNNSDLPLQNRISLKSNCWPINRKPVKDVIIHTTLRHQNITRQFRLNSSIDGLDNVSSLSSVGKCTSISMLRWSQLIVACLGSEGRFHSVPHHCLKWGCSSVPTSCVLVAGCSKGVQFFLYFSTSSIVTRSILISSLFTARSLEK
jgi:hypothetical protein